MLIMEIERKAYKRHRKGAKKRKICYSLQFRQFSKLRSGPCFYCGIRRPKLYTGGWIDRLDSAVGYVNENCVSCCFECNTLKSVYPKELVPLLAYYRVVYQIKRNGQVPIFCARIIQRNLLDNLWPADFCDCEGRQSASSSH